MSSDFEEKEKGDSPKKASMAIAAALALVCTQQLISPDVAKASSSSSSSSSSSAGSSSSGTSGPAATDSCDC